jgi:hypothetical protein
MGREPFSRTGYPVLLHLRRVVEDARDFAGALRMLTRQRLIAPALFTLVGTANEERVVIERSPRRHALRWAEGDAPLIATNDYRALFRPATSSINVLYETTCRRFDSLSRMLRAYRADDPHPDEHLLYVLTDTAVLQTITAQHVIIRPQTQQIRLFVPRRLLGASGPTPPSERPAN